ncbi:hypothetical protein XaFJ1_GM003165 [Xanthomonas albilineans]|nr:hypothetical protein XaFJ1_GM003165 [Xanthomonas albilineans]
MEVEFADVEWEAEITGMVRRNGLPTVARLRCAGLAHG